MAARRPRAGEDATFCVPGQRFGDEFVVPTLGDTTLI